MAEGSDSAILAGHEYIHDFNCTLCINCKNGSYTEAAYFCPECNVLFCKQCFFTFGCDHGALGRGKVDKWGKPPDSQRISFDECPDHKSSPVHLYCEKDDIVCCVICEKTDHRNCGQLKYIPLVASTKKTTDTLKTLQTDLQQLQTTNEDLLKHWAEKLADLQNNHRKLSSEIKQIKARYISKLDYLEQESLKEVNTFKAEFEEKFKSELKTVDDIKSKVSELQSKLNNANINDALKFARMKQGKALVLKSREIISGMSGSKVPDRRRCVTVTRLDECLHSLHHLVTLSADTSLDPGQIVCPKVTLSTDTSLDSESSDVSVDNASHSGHAASPNVTLTNDTPLSSERVASPKVTLATGTSLDSGKDTEPKHYPNQGRGHGLGMSSGHKQTLATPEPTSPGSEKVVDTKQCLKQGQAHSLGMPTGHTQTVTLTKPMTNLKANRPYTVTQNASINVKIKEDKSTCRTEGMCQLPDGSLLSSDRENSILKRLDDRGRVIGNCPLSDRPRDVCNTEVGEVAVALFSKTIQFVTVGGDAMATTRSFATRRACYSLAYHNKRLYVISCQGTDVYVYSPSGSLLHIFNTDKNGNPLFSYTMYITVCPVAGCIYVADGNKGLVKLDLEGNPLVNYKLPELAKGVDSVCVDGVGNVFVRESNSGTNTVVQIGRDGDTILAQSNKTCAHWLCFDKVNKRLLMSAGYSDTVTVMHLTQ